MKKISTLMILSDHIITQFDLLYRCNDESILHKHCRFKNTADLSGKGDIDGHFIIYNNKRNIFIRSGMAEVGFLRRWNEHLAVSMLITHITREVYMAYPNYTCHQDNLHKGYLRFGLFQQLEHQSRL